MWLIYHFMHANSSGSQTDSLPAVEHSIQTDWKFIQLIKNAFHHVLQVCQI